MNNNWGLLPENEGLPPFGETNFEPPKEPKPSKSNKKKREQNKRNRKRRGLNLIFGTISDWWNKEPEEEDNSLELQQQEEEARKKAEEDAARKKEEEISLSKEFTEHNAVTFTIEKPLDPFDEIEITLHVVPLDIGTGDNISLIQPSFKFTMIEPDEVPEETDQVYQGVGTNLPDRIFVMNNRDYNLGVANHADKWAVFWLFTVGVSCFPRCLER